MKQRLSLRALATALALGLTAAVAAPVLADEVRPRGGDVIPSKSEVGAARAQVASTAAAVGQLEAQLELARQQLAEVQIAAAQAAEAYNGARYRLHQARQIARLAQHRAAAAAAEVESQRQRLEVFAVGSATDATEMAQLGTVLSAGGPQELLTEYGAWSSTTAALQADLDAWDATRTVADLLQAEADAAFERQRAAAAEARAARAAAELAVRTATAQQAALENETNRLVRELARVQQISVSLAEQRQQELAERAAEQAAAEQAAREAARRAAREQAREEAREAARAAAREQAEQPEQQGAGGQQPEPAPEPAPDPAPEPAPDPSPSPPPAPNPPPAPTPPPAPNPPSPSGASAAIAFAKAQLGEPYVWGAAGPDAWDCSGLTMGAWSAGGSYLPHYSVAQYAATTPISSGSLRPGDLLFWSSSGSPSGIYHVALYLGDGQMIHAPRTGRTVEIVSMYYWIPPNLFSRV